MAPNYSSLHEQLLKKITAALPKAASKQTTAFVREFYALATVADLKELAPEPALRLALDCDEPGLNVAGVKGSAPTCTACGPGFCRAGTRSRASP